MLMGLGITAGQGFRGNKVSGKGVEPKSKRDANPGVSCDVDVVDHTR